ncbi:hypothetical protein APSETT445_003792 [Aspergillus pseudonomiae]
MRFPEAIVDWVMWPFRTLEFRVNLVGDYDCGKTTLLYQMKLGELVTTIPTIGFNVETVEYPNKYNWTIWDMSSEHLWILLNKQDTLPPESAAEIVDGLRKKYQKEMAKWGDQLSWRILDHRLSAKTGEGVLEILRQLHSSADLLLRTRPKPQPQPSADSKREPEIVFTLDEPEDTVSSPSQSEPIDKRASQDPVNPQAFWDSFVTGDIPVWDHHAHLKVTYIVVLEYVKRRQSTFAMADVIIAHLRRLQNSLPEKFRNRLQIAIRNYRIANRLGGDPLWIDFYKVLFHTPSVMDTRLWTSYYSTKYLFHPRAWDSWTPPDRQPLPVVTSLLDKPASFSTKQGDPARLMRFAFVFTSQCEQISESYDEDAIKQALITLQSTTIRLRAIHTVTPPYSETQARFWLHMVRACLQSLEIPQGDSREIIPSQLTFDGFMALFGLTPTSWKRYYTQKTWDGLAARVQYVAPDRRMLPNVINISAHNSEVKAIMRGIEKEALHSDSESLEDVLLATYTESAESSGTKEQRVDIEAFLSCCDDGLNHEKGSFDD